MTIIDKPTVALFNALKVGSQIEVNFGSRGKQGAKVVKITKDGNVYVSKYRAKSGRWTKPVRLYPSELRAIYY